MNSWTFRAVIATFGVTLLSLIVYDSEKYSNAVPCYTFAEELDSFDKAAFDKVGDVVDLLLALAFVALSGIGVLAHKALQREEGVSSLHILGVAGAAISVVNSIYFGYVANVRLVEWALAHCSGEFSEAFGWAQRVQYYSLICSAVLLAFALVVQRRRNREGAS